MSLIFVSDFYSDEVLGGAELTTDALLSYNNSPVLKIKSSNITQEFINLYSSHYWIFGNFSHLNLNLLSSISKKIKYSIIEYDYKHCKHRSFEKHANSEGICDCDNSEFGKLINSFFMNAKSIFWMSQLQKDITISKFPNLSQKENIILSSVFSKDQLEKILSLKDKEKIKDSWAYLKSNSWVKGTKEAEIFLKDKHSRPIENLSYDETLQLLSESENLVYLPAGSDTCPRLVIEAKLLNCNLHLNSNVQHQYEDWFKHYDSMIIVEYLKNNHQLFWDNIKKYKIKNVSNPLNQKISVIIPVRNGEKTIEKSLESVLNQTYKNLEVLVVINGTTDKTDEIVRKIQKKDHRLRILYSEPGIVPALNFGIRSSTGDFIARQDCDDIWYKNKLEIQYEYMIHNGFDVLGMQMDVNSNGIMSQSNYPTSYNECVNWLLNSHNPIGHPTVLFKKKILDKVGGYWEMFPYAEDMDLWFRCIKHYKIGNMPSKGILHNFTRKQDYNFNIPKVVSQFYRNLYGITNV